MSDENEYERVGVARKAEDRNGVADEYGIFRCRKAYGLDLPTPVYYVRFEGSVKGDWRTGLPSDSVSLSSWWRQPYMDFVRGMFAHVHFFRSEDDPEYKP